MQNYWDSIYEHLPLVYDPSKVEFKDLFDQYLPHGGSCFEVGCYPGRYLSYLCKNFGYLANGIDSTPYTLSRLPTFLKENGIEIGELFCEDFLTFCRLNSFDIVCSFGFVEHFVNYEGIILKEIQLVNSSGILVQSCPNYNGLQRILHKIFNPVNLNRHFPAAMNLHNWESILVNNGMTILYQGYYRTADFWVEPSEQSRLSGKLARMIQLLSKAIDRRVNFPNPIFSPYMISISRKEK